MIFGNLVNRVNNNAKFQYVFQANNNLNIYIEIKIDIEHPWCYNFSVCAEYDVVVII